MEVSAKKIRRDGLTSKLEQSDQFHKPVLLAADAQRLTFVHEVLHRLGKLQSREFHLGRRRGRRPADGGRRRRQIKLVELHKLTFYICSTQNSCLDSKPNTHRRCRRDETVLSRRVGSVYMNSQLTHDDCQRIRRCERSRWTVTKFTILQPML